MQQFGSSDDPTATSGSAGLVLLYSPAYEQLKPVYLLAPGDIFIGRDPSCAICLPDRSVSRRHAVLSFESNTWHLRDLGGSNGTIVDGEFIDHIELELLHELRVGDTILKFVPTRAETYATHRIDHSILIDDLWSPPPPSELIGGASMKQLRMKLERIAPVDLCVVIQGESGTGKEVVAKEIHRLSKRTGTLQAVNCAAIPANLIESELFGYRKGAFSGADRDKVGIIAAANGGTLLLDEIGDMPLEAQAKLLRVIQTREVYPLGATAGQKVDVRFLSASNRDLHRLVKEDRFRGDLLARLNEFSVLLPPLRERKEDIYALTRHLLARHGSANKTVTFPFMLALVHYDWPYNIRELEAYLRRVSAMSEATQLDPELLPDPIKESMATYGRKRVVDARGASGQHALAFATQPPTPVQRGLRNEVPAEAELRRLLDEYKGNIAAVGRVFGKERMQVHRWLRRYGISPDEFRR